MVMSRKQMSYDRPELAVGAHQQGPPPGARTLWVGELEEWMDE